MLTAEELKQKALRRYHPILEQVILGEDPFPLLIPYKKLPRTGNPADMLRQKDILRKESKAVVGYGPTVEFLAVKTRRYADATVPGKIEFTSLADLTRYVGKASEADRILSNAAVVTTAFPEAKAWVAKRTELLSEENERFWTEVCQVVVYFRTNPKPWVYVRELPLEGIHTKFVETNHRLIIDLLGVVAQAALNEPYTSWQDRLGLRSNSNLVEGRFLDPALAPKLPQHFLAPLNEWNTCEFTPPPVVLVTENRTTFLTLPAIPGCLALLGKGYAVTRLADIVKIHGSTVYYWGDIDQHGFEILASFRSKLSQVRSVLMDAETADQFAALATRESVEATLPEEFVATNLSEAERQLWQRCATTHFRLEQEHLPHPNVKEILSHLKP